MDRLLDYELLRMVADGKGLKGGDGYFVYCREVCGRFVSYDRLWFHIPSLASPSWPTPASASQPEKNGFEMHAQRRGRSMPLLGELDDFERLPEMAKFPYFLSFQLGSDLIKTPHRLVGIQPLPTTQANLSTDFDKCGVVAAP